MPNKTVTIDGVQLTALEDDHITKILARGLYYERDLLEAISEMALVGTYVDVGAFIGTHALWFAMRCPSTQVIAIEPNRDSLCYLRKNIRDNQQEGKIRVEPCAVHDTYTRCTSRIAKPDNKGSARIREKGDIPAKRLDDLLASVEDVVLLKLDVEGVESSVLASARETIAKHKPVIITEAWNSVMRKQQQQVLPDYEVVARYCSTPTLIWLPKGSTHGL